MYQVVFRENMSHQSTFLFLLCSDEEGADGLEILMDPPEGFRNSDEDRFSESQESSVEDVQDLGQIEMPEDQEEQSEEKGDEQHGEDTPHGQEERPSTPGQLATTVP